MSATADLTTPGWGTIDIHATPRVPFARLVSVELRKTRDTRAGLWLLIAMGVVTAAVMAIQLAFIVSEDDAATYNSFLQSTTYSISIFLPILGILLLTSEWSQRTAMVTFSLEPHRLRVVAAKLVVGVILAVGAVVASLVLGAVANLLYGALSGNALVWDMSAAGVGGFLLFQLLGILIGFAFAAVLLSSPGAIVAFMVWSFVLPGIFAIGTALDWFARIEPWINFATASMPLADASMNGENWAHLLVSLLIWLVLPMAIGLRRVLRAEVK